MKEYDFVNYITETDKIKIYSDDLNKFFETKFNINVQSIDFDENENVVLFVEYIKSKTNYSLIVKKLLKEIPHLNNAEVKNTKIILYFDVNEIELC